MPRAYPRQIKSEFLGGGSRHQYLSLNRPCRGRLETEGARLKAQSWSVFVLFCFNMYLLFWASWVSIAVCGLSAAVANGGYALAVCRLLITGCFLLWPTGSKVRLISLGTWTPTPHSMWNLPRPDPRPLHWVMDSEPLDHQGSP